MSRKIQIAIVTLMIATSVSKANGSLIRFDWTDDQGTDGHFVWETDGGYSPSAISEFAYIYTDGTPTPPGFIPTNFSTTDALPLAFNWDLRIAAEGVSLNFDTAFTAPLPDTPATYESAFTGGQYLSQSGTRTWNQISVTAVPEPRMAFLFLAATAVLVGRGIRQRWRRADIN